MEKPKKIYKYQSLSLYSLRNLKNNHIYFNSPSNFNDPFDTFQEVRIKDMSKDRMKDSFLRDDAVRKLFELMEEGLATSNDSKTIFEILSRSMNSFTSNLSDKLNYRTENKSDMSWEVANRISNSVVDLQKYICSTFYDTVNDLVKLAMKSIKEKGMYSTGVSCFCEVNDNMLMWSHYADSHKGFCLEFDTSYEPFTKMFPITYSKEIPEVDLNKIIGDPDNNLESIKANLLHKYIDWAYEKEWRILHQDKATSFCYMTNALTGIYFGTKIDFTDLEIITTIVKGHHSKCKFYKMDKVSGEFKVEPRQFHYTTFLDAKIVVTNDISKQLIRGKGYREVNENSIYSNS